MGKMRINAISQNWEMGIFLYDFGIQAYAYFQRRSQPYFILWERFIIVIMTRARGLSYTKVGEHEASPGFGDIHFDLLQSLGMKLLTFPYVLTFLLPISIGSQPPLLSALLCKREKALPFSHR